MHKVLKKKCRQNLIVHPCLGRVDGDKNFGDSYTLRCFAEPKIQIIRNMEGEEVVSDTTIFLDGVLFSQIKSDDEIELDLLGRREIHNLQVFPALKGDGYDHLEVYV